MTSYIEHFPVKSLMERYNIERSVLYNRLKGLGISPTKIGRRSYITVEELELLDQLHEYIQGVKQPDSESFQTIIKKVVKMPQNQTLNRRVQELGLNVVNVMWEDTARTMGSVWGANISDMTLQVRNPNQPHRKELLPVIRYPNFTDKTGDIPIEQVQIKVGNEKGESLEVITLQEYLTNLSEYLSNFHSSFDNHSLITEKDTHVLVNAQACFLPVPKQEKCQFNPVLFNYQSRKNHPTLLALLVTTEGTSATIIDNANDLAEWGQNLYFNNDGQKTCLTGERLTDYKETEAKAIAKQKNISLEQARSEIDIAKDINMVMIIQVPIKYKERDFLEDSNLLEDSDLLKLEELQLKETEETESLCLEFEDACFEEYDCLDDAVIGHGEDEGEHLELGKYKINQIERDKRYPIRTTVQFYKATSNGVIDEKDLDNIRQWIDMAYTSADYVGSLVTGTLEKGELEMGEARPTQSATSTNTVNEPPKDYLEVVNPFASHHQPKA